MADMDIPPVDHGSDRYDHIEVIAPTGIPTPRRILAALVAEGPCQDCRANAFVRYAAPDPTWPRSQPRFCEHGHTWFVAVAHDDTCPTLRAEERRG